MLINALSLKNFKCFEEIDIDFGKITLLTGANSSGKSSLIYSILAMLQTENFPFYLSPNGKYVNLGSYEEMVLDKKKDIEINFMFSKTLDITNDFSYVIDKNKIESIWGNDTSTDVPILKEVEIVNEDWIGVVLQIRRWKNKSKVTFNFSDLNMFSTKEKYNDLLKVDELKYHLSDDKKIFENNEYIQFKGVFNSIDDVFKKIIDKRKTIIQGTDDPFSSDLKQIDDAFNYIGSYRLPPERTYYRKAQSSKIGISGEGYIDQIIDWEESNPDKFKELVSKLSELQLLTDIKSSKLKGGRFEIGVKTHKHSKVASLTDVGFGISQFLPIIVADLQLPNHSCLTVSQPEIHLHPKIQATLGNYLVNQINSTDKQYLVETHSEYLLNRLRLLIAKGELKSEDIKIYYLENDGEKSISHPITFTKHGEILGAPDGFFDTYMMDVFDIALTAE